uniref:Uncharacterized protein n=1 Tax=Oryza punctata TaxID=4537 RepID=A0A0E0KY59_ORYPU
MELTEKPGSSCVELRRSWRYHPVDGKRRKKRLLYMQAEMAKGRIVVDPGICSAYLGCCTGIPVKSPLEYICYNASNKILYNYIEDPCRDGAQNPESEGSIVCLVIRTHQTVGEIDPIQLHYTRSNSARNKLHIEVAY